MRWYLRYWYDISAIIALIVVVMLIIAGDCFSYVQQLLLGNFIFMQLHFFEEFHCPGGFPGVCNIAEFHSDKPTHYPLNQLSAALGNNWFGLFVYLLPVFLPQITWLVLAPILFGFLELFMHTIVFNKLLKTRYNPGLLTSLIGFTPIGIAYLYYAVQNQLLHWTDFLLALGYPLLTYLLIFQYIGIKVLGNRNTKYPGTLFTL